MQDTSRIKSPWLNHMPMFKKIRINTFYFICCFFIPPSVWANAMENYINNIDPHFHWETTKIITKKWGTISQYKLISQNWRGHKWSHELLLVRPKQIRNPDIAFLKIAGDGKANYHLNSLMTLARRGGAVTAVLMNVPNQPLYENRSEDALIAYTLNQYLKTKDETWPLLFPMVKSAIKAMDAVQQIVKQQHHQEINNFVLSGASKRGWTTWLTAAVDSRITAIAPLVIDMLNMKQQLQWSELVYGKQSTKLKDYTELNLHRKMDNQDMKRLRSWIDPYSYTQRFTMPKLILLGTNDPYWTVDSLRHYWNDLPEPKLIYQTPNAGHNLNGGEQALQTLAAFFELIADKKQLPTFDWKFSKTESTNISTQVTINQAAKQINLWSAYSEDRDFRDNQWEKYTIEKNSAYSYSLDAIPAPSTGYRAFMIEVELQTDSGHDFKLSTQAKVIPDSKLCQTCIAEKNN